MIGWLLVWVWFGVWAGLKPSWSPVETTPGLPRRAWRRPIDPILARQWDAVSVAPTVYWHDPVLSRVDGELTEQQINHLRRQWQQNRPTEGPRWL